MKSSSEELSEYRAARDWSIADVIPGVRLSARPGGQLIDAAMLRTSGKILFIAHLALGDFTYLQSCFRAFARAFPHIEMHLWVDERRRTNDAAQWAHLQKYALYDWLAESTCFTKVYARTYSPALYEESIDEAQREAYPIVVSLATLERHKYALLARRISPHGFVAGQKKRVRFYDIPKRLIYRKLDAAIPAYSAATHPGQHISEIYAGWFTLLFGIHISAAARYPVLTIPERWMAYASEQFAQWGFDGGRDVIFLNSFSKSPERNWPVERLITLIKAMRNSGGWEGASFIINVVPEELARVKHLFAGRDLSGIRFFSAEENFFQLPAVLRRCRLIISVETAVMHLANALHVPVVALMRQKNPEWAPIDTRASTVITVARRDDCIARLTVADVMAVLQKQRLRAGASGRSAARLRASGRTP
ncbi:glycosyltransferase family 9 protein [Massilia sp. S19_KUP03_FR1]|uniref:glycosyltransferase family 9 protein n=1 Tax=Massilia sp. S19_KUP03_FR1 TaxID=3025503 RepID=UPI002FCDCC40